MLQKLNLVFTLHSEGNNVTVFPLCPLYLSPHL